MLRYVLLGLMMNGRSVHGYALMKAFAARSGMRVSIGNVYRELQQLRESGFIAATANPAGADPRRCPYTITDAGRSAFKRWSRSPARYLVRESFDPLLYRLVALGGADDSLEVGFLNDVRAELLSQCKHLERERALLSEREGDASPMLAVLLARRARRLAADVTLVEEARAAMAARETRLPAKRARALSDRTRMKERRTANARP